MIRSEPARPLDWSRYELFEPITQGPLRDLPRKEARAAYRHLMDQKADRISQLTALCEANGVELGKSTVEVQSLNDWFWGCVELGEGTHLSARWYSVVVDCGLFLGEVLIEQSLGTLEWQFFIGGKYDYSRHQAVIAGFDVPNPQFHFNIEMVLAGYARRIAQGLHESQHKFVEILEEGLAKAPNRK